MSLKGPDDGDQKYKIDWKEKVLRYKNVPEKSLNWFAGKTSKIVLW